MYISRSLVPIKKLSVKFYLHTLTVSPSKAYHYRKSMWPQYKIISPLKYLKGVENMKIPFETNQKRLTNFQ